MPLTLSLLRAFSSSRSACLMESSWERAEFPNDTEVEANTETAFENPLDEPLDYGPTGIGTWRITKSGGGKNKNTHKHKITKTKQNWWGIRRVTQKVDVTLKL